MKVEYDEHWNEGFSARWMGRVGFQEGDHEFVARVDKVGADATSFILIEREPPGVIGVSNCEPSNSLRAEMPVPWGSLRL